MNIEEIRKVAKWVVCLLPVMVFSDCRGVGNRNAGGETDSRKEVVVFIYHRFGDARYPSTSVRLEDFRQHLRFLKEGGCTVMTIGEAVEYIANPDMPFVEKAVVLTVDDGFSTFYSNAMPLLRKYGFRATLFINPGSIGGSDYMRWEQLKEVREEGIEIGNHSYGHPHFLDIAEPERARRFEEDVERAQEVIHTHLGFYPDVFAYPYGEFDDMMQSTLERLGFRAAMAQYSGVLYAGTDLFAVPRFSMVGNLAGIDGFREKASMKALRVAGQEPDYRIVRANRLPDLDLVVGNSGHLRTRQAQCFVQGADCQLQTRREEGRLHMTIRVEGEPTQRRHVYTVTMPDTTGTWHWFSKQWVFPAFQE